MSSVAGLRGSASLAGYCATKGGVRLFAKAVAMECAAFLQQCLAAGHICPGEKDAIEVQRRPRGVAGRA
jgi:NAD(P)-dependent dehydrogenase (short-subunit alcohol dehydrogenase family)